MTNPIRMVLTAAPVREEGGAVDDWRTIDSAPIGEPVQVYWPCMALDDEGILNGETLDREGHVSLSIRHSQKHCWEPDNVVEANGDWFGDDFEFGQPTHWRPRPSRPGAALATREEALACLNCGGKGYTEHEGGDGEGYPSHPVIESCSCREEAPAEAGALKIDFERLLDNIACATQNRSLLRGDPAEDRALTEAILLNVQHEIDLALRAQPQAREEAQPVAWTIRYAGDSDKSPLAQVTMSEEFAMTMRRQGHEVIALYTTPPAPDERLRVAVTALDEAVWSLSSFGQLADDDGGGNTEGLDDEVVVRMTFPDPEFGGEETLLGELFIRAFRKARTATSKLREALAALQQEGR